MQLLLASTSVIRQKILANAGFTFECWAPQVDEAALKERYAKLSPARLCEQLALEKARSAVAVFPEACIIAADQILSFKGRAYDKIGEKAQAFARIKMLQGCTHTLMNGLAMIYRNRSYSCCIRNNITFHAMEDSEIRCYLQACSPDVESSVGVYQLESIGIRCIKAIEGDYFSACGLPILEVTERLRKWFGPSFTSKK